MIRTKRSDKVRFIKDINITPFTDVCLVLLIIFMVTASALTKEKSLELDLPESSTADTRLESSVTVRVARDQQLYVNDNPIAYPELGARLKVMRDKYDTKLLVIKADGRVPYNRVVEIIDAGREAGIAKYGLATREPDQIP
jgi:biopolymer transport protein ExbD